ncbi:DUF3048 domain-containing protein, partial [Ruminococcaceae bacterium OttesenSCG-928-D13]|nr:DUF3048 domain-containing protein [Ruminococcaceae bacterium OttesenSCG-928-D13]
MKKMLSLMLAVLILAGLLAACSGDSSSPAPEAPSFTVQMPGDDSSTAPEPEPEPEPPLERAFLTGLEKGPDYPEGKRITAVMMNNQYNARPQNGTSEAQMIVEVLVEYGITRMMAVYEDYEKIPEKVGGLRSARDQYFQLIIPYWAFFVHEGPSHPSHPVNVMMDQYAYHDFDVQAKYYPIYKADSSRSTEQYNWYDVSGASITKFIEETGADPSRTYNSPIFDFVPYTDPPRVPADGDAASIAVTHSSSTISYFDYDAATGKYAMSQYGGGGKHKTVDNLNSQQLAFENVLVLFAPMDIWPNTAPENLPKFNYGDGGVGYYFSQGRYELVLWRKGAAQDPLLLYTTSDDGQMVKVNTGKTYLA